MAGVPDLAEKFWFAYQECWKGVKTVDKDISIDDGSILQCAIQVFKAQYGKA